VDPTDDGLGCVAMPVRLSIPGGAGGGAEGWEPALLCMCGVQSGQDLSPQEMNYRAMLINDVLGSNVANALSYSETKRQASEDSLTAINTRRVFDEVLHEEWSRAKRYGTEFSVALLDVDHLKRANDTCGHLAGDEMLKSTAHIIQEGVRNCDTAARYGGDEFVILMPETSAEGAAALAERIRSAIAATPVPALAPLSDDGTPVCVSVSIGVAHSVGHSSAEAMLISADQALYESKRNGRGRVTLAESSPGGREAAGQ